MKFTILLLLLSTIAQGQITSLCDIPDTTFSILHFTKTNGFNHNTRTESNDMFVSIGDDNQFTVTNTQDASVFNNLTQLNTYAVVVFSNTSDNAGNPLFTSSQQANFEAYINGGGSFIGIHAASDTYRSGWPFYTNLLGAAVQSSPNHTSRLHMNYMDHHSTHEVLDGIPDPWFKQEEYYYWDLNGGQIFEDSIATLLKVRETGSNSYDRERPITWLRTFSSGARSFYTALGHDKSNYTSNIEFKQLLTNAVCWAAYDKNSFANSNITAKLEGTNLTFDQAGNGVILTSPNGSCFKITVGDDGQLRSIPIPCN